MKLIDDAFSPRAQPANTTIVINGDMVSEGRFGRIRDVGLPAQRVAADTGINKVCVLAHKSRGPAFWHNVIN